MLNTRHTYVFTLFVMMIAVLALVWPMDAALSARMTLPGPLPGEVVSVYDGDTFDVRVRVWVDQIVETHVRVNGIDAPEIHGKCEKEKKMAQEAKQELAQLVQNGKVRLYNVRFEKYAGRVLADVETADGKSIGQHMIDQGLVRAYHGKKRQSWCEG